MHNMKDAHQILPQAHIEQGDWRGTVKVGRFVGHQEPMSPRDVFLRLTFCSRRGGRQALFVAHLRGCPALAAILTWRFQRPRTKVPQVTPSGWLKGTRWEGMPYHVTLGHPDEWSLLPAPDSDISQLYV